MNGFGDPSAGGLGFGDPTPASTFESLGFGDPSEIDIYYISLDSRNVYHSGGAEVTFKGIILEDLAPYRAEITINGSPVFFHSGVVGFVEELRPIRGELIAYTPPAPAGVYPLTLRFGVNYSQSVTLSITYHPDNRGAQRYRLRELFPAHYSTGARASELESLDLALTVDDETNLESVTDTIGRVFQELSGSAETITRALTNRGSSILSLESVLGFAESGRVWVGRSLLDYVSIDLNNHTLTLSEPLRVAVKENERVVFHAP